MIEEERQEEQVLEEEEVKKENQKELKPILSTSLTDASTQAILQALENGVSEEELFSIGETNKPRFRGENKSNQESLNELVNLSSQGRPIPGQSLVNSPDSKYPWENPPTFANPREALDDITTTILSPDIAKNIVQALAKGAAAIDLSMGVLYSKFIQGDISLDNLLLLAEPATYMIMALGEEANIKYNIEGNDLDELDGDDLKEQFENKLNEFNTAVGNIKNITKQKINTETINEKIVPPSILEKVKETGSEIRQSLLDRGEK